jgi:hypothetical protein
MFIHSQTAYTKLRLSLEYILKNILEYLKAKIVDSSKKIFLIITG